MATKRRNLAVADVAMDEATGALLVAPGLAHLGNGIITTADANWTSADLPTGTLEVYFRVDANAYLGAGAAAPAADGLVFEDVVVPFRFGCRGATKLWAKRVAGNVNVRWNAFG